MQVSLVADLEPLTVPCFAFLLGAACLSEHASGVCNFFVRANVTVGWLLAQLSFVDQVPISGQIEKVVGTFK